MRACLLAFWMLQLLEGGVCVCVCVCACECVHTCVCVCICVSVCTCGCVLMLAVCIFQDNKTLCVCVYTCECVCVCAHVYYMCALRFCWNLYFSIQQNISCVSLMLCTKVKVRIALHRYISLLRTWMRWWLETSVRCSALTVLAETPLLPRATYICPWWVCLKKVECWSVYLFLCCFVVFRGIPLDWTWVYPGCRAVRELCMQQFSCIVDSVEEVIHFRQGFKPVSLVTDSKENNHKIFE